MTHPSFSPHALVRIVWVSWFLPGRGRRPRRGLKTLGYPEQNRPRPVAARCAPFSFQEGAGEIEANGGSRGPFQEGDGGPAGG